MPSPCARQLIQADSTGNAAFHSFAAVRNSCLSQSEKKPIPSRAVSVHSNPKLSMLGQRSQLISLSKAETYPCLETPKLISASGPSRLNAFLKDLSASNDSVVGS